MDTSRTNRLLSLQKDFFQHLGHKGRSVNTLKNYKTDLDCFNNYLSSKNITTRFEDFSIPQIIEYGKFLEVKYNSDNSRRRRVQALRLFFDYLVERGIFRDNPVKKIPTSPKFVDIPRPTTFSNVKTLWLHLLEESKTKKSRLDLVTIRRNQLIFALIYLGGLKVSDMAKLKREHFSFLKNPRVMILHPKRDPYSVELPAVFRSIYESYIDILDKIMKDNRHDFSEILFNANAHKILSGGLSARGIELIFDSWRHKLVMEVTPKSLRQSCIYTWLKNEVNDTIIKEKLGLSPSYSLKPYKDSLSENIFNDDFVEITFHSLMG